MRKRVNRTIELMNRPRVISAAAVVGDVEGRGPLGNEFDIVCEDDTLGLASWEKAESKMFQLAVERSLEKIGMSSEELDCLIGGDLLDQIISSGFAARELEAAFIGLYSACSTITEALMIGSMLVNAGYLRLAACAASSHFSSVERQFRFPLEMGTQAVPTAQRTVTGAGSIILAADAGSLHETEEAVFRHTAVSSCTIGRVRDFEVTDAGNMGAAMAPAAADTIRSHLFELGRNARYYDRIVTGDLGVFGSDMLISLLAKDGIDIKNVHEDCGCLIFGEDQAPQCGASGCGCAASVISSHYLRRIESGELSRVLFVATGALLSPLSSLQHESIPSIAHAAVMEHID